MNADFLVSRRMFLSGAASAGSTLAAGPFSAAATSVRQRPNIVLITADDLGYGDLSGYGRADFQTPVLDRLAAQGTRFTQAYAIAPVCTPTRVGLMTGQYPARHPIGLHEPLTSRDFGLDPSGSILASLLKKSGYTNALVGKWHLGARPQFHPNRHGFDEFFGPLSGAIDYVAHTSAGGGGTISTATKNPYTSTAMSPISSRMRRFASFVSGVSPSFSATKAQHPIGPGRLAVIPPRLHHGARVDGAWARVRPAAFRIWCLPWTRRLAGSLPHLMRPALPSGRW